MEEARPALRAADSEPLRRWKSSTVVEDALMHCVSEDKQTLWYITEADKHKRRAQNVENAVLGLVKLNALPPDAYDTRGPRNLRFFHAINNKCVYKQKLTRGLRHSCISWEFADCQHDGMLTVPRIHTHKTLNPVSMQNTQADQHDRGFQQRPTMEGSE